MSRELLLLITLIINIKNSFFIFFYIATNIFLIVAKRNYNIFKVRVTALKMTSDKGRCSANLC